MVFSIAYELSKLDEPLRSNVSEQIQMVQSKQREKGMEPRDDSKLTFQFATNNTDFSLDEITNELVLHDAIFRNTEYGDHIEELMRYFANYIVTNYKLHWGDTYKIVRTYVPQMYKLHCAQKYFSHQ